MARSMAALEYSRIARELQPLVGKRFQKIYTLSSGYRLKIGDADIIVEPGVRLHPTQFIDEGEELDNFAKKVRKELGTSPLLSVKQLNNDRVLSMEFKHGTLFFEMFAKGNVILVRDGKTVACVKEEKWSDRVIKPGKPYAPPKSSTVSSVKDTVSQKYIAACLMRLPLGKPYVQEALHRAGIDEKAPGSSLSPRQLASLQEACDAIASADEPRVFLEGDQPIDFALTPLSNYHDSKAFKSLSEAMDFFYSNVSDEGGPSEDELKLQRRLEKQQEQLKELNAAAEAAKAKGDFIYEKYQEVEAILQESKKCSLEELEKKLAKRKAKVNKKEKSLELEL